MPVPDSGVCAAIGYAEESGIPMRVGLIRNHYVGRTFIEPQQSIRHFGVRVKLNPVRSILEGRRVVLVDDSLVRGTTSRKIVKMVKAAGAKEVHMRISCPPTISPCFYGVDTPRRSELIAATHTLEEIQKYIGADSVGYLSLEGLLSAVGTRRIVLLHVLLHRPVPGGVSAQRSGVSAAGAETRHRCGQDVASACSSRWRSSLRRDAAAQAAPSPGCSAGARPADVSADAIQVGDRFAGQPRLPHPDERRAHAPAGAGRGRRARTDSSRREPQGSVRPVPRARPADRLQRRADRRSSCARLSTNPNDRLRTVAYMYFEHHPARDMSPRC